MNNKSKHPSPVTLLPNLEGCQLPCLPKFAEGTAEFGPQPFIYQFKRAVAQPWNNHIKKWLQRFYMFMRKRFQLFTLKDGSAMAENYQSVTNHFEPGDWVMVRPLGEIQKTLNPFKELKGCAFMEVMKQYCGTQQRVLKVMERFVDERDYKVKKTRGVVLLEGVHCQGTPVFGRCDRSCLFFWREEWLERIELSA